MEKKYILFQWFDYEAYGGLHDITESFDTLEEALDYGKANINSPGENEVIDRDTWERVGVIGR